MKFRVQWQLLLFVLTLIVAASLPAAAESGKRKSTHTRPETHRKAASLDLSIPRVGDPLPDDRQAAETDFYAAIRRQGDPALEASATGSGDDDRYRVEPLFRSDQKLQILDAEVPVSLKLGKWKTSEESKALGLSATMPLPNPN